MSHPPHHVLEDLAAPLVELASEAAAGVTGGVAAADVNGDGPAALNVAADIVSPRDPASGLPTGKRTYKP